jgi:two-component system, NtrC family, sensor kinase
MQRPRWLTRATRLPWQIKLIIPIVGVLLIGLLAFNATVQTLRVPNGHWILIVAASGAVMICFVLLWVLLVLIERPLNDLKHTIERVRKGHLDARVQFAKRDDDVGQLGRQFNEMIRQLSDNRAEIERLHHAQMARAEHLASLGELATGLAHEIRNPLAGIAGVVDVMGTELPPGSPSRGVLADVRDEIHYIQRILNDLLAYARPRPPQFLAADLNATVEQAVLLAREQTRGKPIDILFSPQNNLPPVTHDPAQIQQVLLNLLLNGIQAIPEKGTIEITLWHESSRVLIRVADTGSGIPADALTNIFKPFFTTRKEGTGLGLPLAKGIIEAHGGKIEVASTPEHGTHFDVSLPIHR